MSTERQRGLFALILVRAAAFQLKRGRAGVIITRGSGAFTLRWTARFNRIWSRRLGKGRRFAISFSNGTGRMNWGGGRPSWRIGY